MHMLSVAIDIFVCKVCLYLFQDVCKCTRLAVLWGYQYGDDTETSASIYQTTRCYIPEDILTPTRRSENL